MSPSAVAVERVLWLAAIDRCLHTTAGDSPAVVAATRDLLTLTARHRAALYAAVPVPEARVLRWILAVRAHAPSGLVTWRAAIVAWAAVACWTDAPGGRWGALADAGAALAGALDAAIGGDGWVPGTWRAASELRATMGEWMREAG